jgi:putative heme transporter
VAAGRDRGRRLLGREREILAQVTAGLDEGGSLAGTGTPDTDQAARLLGDVVQLVVSGLLSGLSSATVLIVGVVTGLFILLFLMKDWRLVTDATSDRIAALLRLPAGVGRQIVTDTVGSFRSYALGVTIIGLMNGAVIGRGALVLDVPLVVPIALVNFVTSYIPFFGAFFAGAFAVLVTLGANGLSVAVAMLAITLLTNNTLENLLEPLVFGKTLRLHPLVVMLVTTTGTLLFGLLGATLAAPVTAVALRTG